MRRPAHACMHPNTTDRHAGEQDLGATGQLRNAKSTMAAKDSARCGRCTALAYHRLVT